MCVHTTVCEPVSPPTQHTPNKHIHPQVWRRGGGEIMDNDLFDRRFDVQRANLRNNLLETIPWLRKLLRDINWPDVRLCILCICVCVLGLAACIHPLPPKPKPTNHHPLTPIETKHTNHPPQPQQGLNHNFTRYAFPLILAGLFLGPPDRDHNVFLQVVCMHTYNYYIV